jgi:hypothetical protein
VLAAQLGVSRMMVQRVWQHYDIQPHRVEKFRISKDPKFEDKVRDVVGLYLDPPDRALVLCVDGKSQIQGLDRTAPVLPLRPGLRLLFTVISPTLIQATVPPGAITGYVRVMLPSGRIPSNKKFRVTPPITSFAPTSGRWEPS